MADINEQRKKKRLKPAVINEVLIATSNVKSYGLSILTGTDTNKGLPTFGRRKTLTLTKYVDDEQSYQRALVDIFESNADGVIDAILSYIYLILPNALTTQMETDSVDLVFVQEQESDINTFLHEEVMTSSEFQYYNMMIILCFFKEKRASNDSNYMAWFENRSSAMLRILKLQKSDLSYEVPLSIISGRSTYLSGLEIIQKSMLSQISTTPMGTMRHRIATYAYEILAGYGMTSFLAVVRILCKTDSIIFDDPRIADELGNLLKAITFMSTKGIDGPWVRIKLGSIQTSCLARKNFPIIAKVAMALAQEQKATLSNSQQFNEQEEIQGLAADLLERHRDYVYNLSVKQNRGGGMFVDLS